MTKARDLADLIAAGNPLADGAISVSEISDLTASAADLNNVAGINSSVQTQLDAKAPLASPTLTGTVTMGGTTYPTSDGTEGQVLTTNGSGAVSFADPAGGGSADFVASGAIANGDVVVLNSDGTVSVAGLTTVSTSFGSGVVYESASVGYLSSTYHPTENKVVIFYKDSGNSNRGTYIVGTVSGSSLSFGTAGTFSTSGAENFSSAYDIAANKIVICYTDLGNSNYGTAVVGTLSGTTMSFGSAVVFSSSHFINNAMAYDSSAGKIAIAYRDHGNSGRGTGIVGTVSGTSISFGSPTVFSTTGAAIVHGAAYDTNAGKVVVSFSDSGSPYTGKGTAIVGTISGTSISFGSKVIFDASGAANYTEVAYDPTAQKVVIAYSDTGDSGKGKAIVGTVSGTSISFGTAVTYETSSAGPHAIIYSPKVGRVVIFYRDGGNSNERSAIVGTVSGTSITFDAKENFGAARSDYYAPVYDEVAEKIVLAYEDQGNSYHGYAIVMTTGGSFSNITSTNYIGVADGATSDTATGKITINGGVNEGQSSLAVGTTYYVADNGDLQTTNNGRKIGKAISATKLLVNSNMSGDEMNAYLGGLV